MASRQPPHAGSPQKMAGKARLLHELQVCQGEQERLGGELRRTQRMLRMISECNRALVRATGETGLLDAVCRIAVEHGGYCLAWVGFAETDAAKTVRPVAQAGFAKGYLETVNITWADAERGHGPTGTAIRTGQHVIARNIATDPTFGPWRQAAIQHGYASSIALPLSAHGQILGALMIYSAATDTFDAPEVALLTDLARDVAYGITAMRTSAEHKHMEEQARLSAKHILYLSKYANDFIILLDERFRFLEVNERAVDFYGYTHDEMIGMHATQLRPPETQGDFSAQIKLAQQSGKALYETVHQRKDGSRFPVEISLHAIDNNGEKIYQAVIRDISERKRAEDALRRSEEQFRLIMENLADLVAVLDLNGCRLYNSPSYGGILGDPDKLRGSSSFDQVHPDDADRVRQAFQDTVRTGMGHRVEYRLLDQHHRPRHIESQGSVIRDPQGRVAQVVVVSRDVTERRQTEEAIRELNTSLEQRVIERTAELAVAKERAEDADRLKSAFLATMSHELRTPLNSIIGFTGILLQQLAGPLNPEQRKQLEMVRDSGRHLLALINDVLDISKIEAGQLKVSGEPFDLRSSIEKTVAIVRPLAEKKGLALHTELAPEIGRLVSDPRRVEQVLLNLLNNAVKFTEHGTVTLTAALAPAALPAAADGVQIAVADTGIGIKPEELGQLFQPFRQVDTGLSRQHEGTGLGLAICRRLAELLGGEVHAASDYGRGSVFTFTLPVKKPGAL